MAPLVKDIHVKKDTKNKKKKKKKRRETQHSLKHNTEPTRPY